MDLLRGASVAGILKGITALLTFALSVVLGRFLGADEAGVYFLALTVATVAATIGRLGLDSAVLRQVAARATMGKWIEVLEVHRAAMGIGLVCSLATTGVLLITAKVIAVSMFSDETLVRPIRLMAISVIPLTLSVLVSRELQAISRVRDSILVFSILPAGIALIGTTLLAKRLAVDGAIISYVIAVAVALVYGWVAWRRVLVANVPTASEASQSELPTRELLRSGAPLLTGAVLQLAIQSSGVLLLGVWGSNTDISVFSVAWRTATLITFALLAINTIAQPKFAELYARNEMGALAVAARRATVLMTVCALPIFLIFMFFPKLVMTAFGSDFTNGGATLQVLAIGQFINVATGSVGVLLVMSGHEREYRNAMVISAMVVMALNVALIPSTGALGAAVAAAAALVVQNVLFGYYVWSKLRIFTFMSRSRDS